MDYFANYAYTRIASDDSEEDEELKRVAVLTNPPVHIDSTKGYVYSPECKVYHTTKGHFNANFPITNTTGYVQCTRCRPTDPRPLRHFYVSSSAAKVYHDTKDHCGADIPTLNTTGRIHCTRCRLIL